MKKVIVGFSYHPGSKFSWLIKKCTASLVSHTYVRVGVGEQQLIYQASGLTVNYTNLVTFQVKNVIVEEYEVELTDDAWDEAKKWRVREVGKSYSMKQLLGCVYVLAMRRLGASVANPFADGDLSYVCVETSCRQIGLKGAEEMTPEDLRRWCKKNATLVG